MLDQATIQERPADAESVYKKIIKHLLSIQFIGYKGSLNVYAVYAENYGGFITNVEAANSSEALDKAVEELVRTVNYL